MDMQYFRLEISSIQLQCKVDRSVKQEKHNIIVICSGDCRPNLIGIKNKLVLIKTGITIMPSTVITEAVQIMFVTSDTTNDHWGHTPTMNESSFPNHLQ